MTSAPAKFQIHARLRRAKRAADAGDLAAAHAMYAALPADFPYEKRAVEEASSGLAELGYFDEAVTVLESAIGRMGESPALLRSLIAQFIAKQRWADAADTLKRMVANDPQNSELLLEWGRFAEAAGRMSDAEDAFRRALAIDPESPDATLSLAGILMIRERYAEAEALLQNEVKRNPRFAEAQIKLSALLLKRRRTMEALTAADAALAINRQGADGHCARGIVLMEMDQPVLAAVAFRRALAIDPHHRESIAHLGRLIRGPEKQVTPVQPPAKPWNGTLVTENQAFAGKITFNPQHSERTLYFGRPLKRGLIQSAMDLLLAAAPNRAGFLSALDLACGTGTIMSHVHDHYDLRHSVGIATATTLRTATEKKIFTRLLDGNGPEVIDEISETFDLIIAIDLFAQIGALEEFMPKIAARLTRGGMVLYSIDVSTSDDIQRAASGRFTHTVDYVARAASIHDLVPVMGRKAASRIEFGREIGAYIGLLKRV